MSLLRTLLLGVALLLLGGGYLASLNAYFQGNALQYTQALDQSSVPYLSLGLLIAVVALAFTRPEPTAEASEDEP
jgi:hypothetical protein